jgi:hypothetical protein
MSEQQSTRPKSHYSWRWVAFAFLIRAALACGVLAETLIQSTPNQAPTSTIEPRWTCHPGPRSSCTLAAAGTNLSTRPVSSWCVANNSYSGGSLTGTTWICKPGPVVLSFNETVGATLSGTFSVNGSFELFLVPAVQGCRLISTLEGAYDNVLSDCAQPLYSPPYSGLNLTPQESNPVNLSSLTFDFGHPSVDVPPAYWSLVVVDIGSELETVHVVSPLAVTPD